MPAATKPMRSPTGASRSSAAAPAVEMRTVDEVAEVALAGRVVDEVMAPVMPVVVELAGRVVEVTPAVPAVVELAGRVEVVPVVSAVESAVELAGREVEVKTVELAGIVEFAGRVLEVEMVVELAGRVVTLVDVITEDEVTAVVSRRVEVAVVDDA